MLISHKLMMFNQEDISRIAGSSDKLNKHTEHAQNKEPQKIADDAVSRAVEADCTERSPEKAVTAVQEATPASDKASSKPKQKSANRTCAPRVPRAPRAPRTLSKAQVIYLMKATGTKRAIDITAADYGLEGSVLQQGTLAGLDTTDARPISSGSFGSVLMVSQLYLKS